VFHFILLILRKSFILSDKIRAQSGPPLPNFRQEAFAQRIAAGCSATAAYASAYGRPRDASSRVNGRRLLTNANIRARIAQIERDAALSSLSTIREVLDAAGCTTVDRIRNGSFKQACKAVDCFADTVLKLSRALSQQSGSDERGSRSHGEVDSDRRSGQSEVATTHSGDDHANRS
jgi:hypothetical protein